MSNNIIAFCYLKIKSFHLHNDDNLFNFFFIKLKEKLVIIICWKYLRLVIWLKSECYFTNDLSVRVQLEHWRRLRFAFQFQSSLPLSYGTCLFKQIFKQYFFNMNIHNNSTFLNDTQSTNQPTIKTSKQNHAYRRTNRIT